MTDHLLLDSLRRRMTAMHTLWYDAVATMGPEHVNHVEREGVLPIAFSLFHYPNMQDVTFAVLTGEPPVWNDDWQSRVHMAIDDHGKERTVDEMIHQRVGDYDAFKDCQVPVPVFRFGSGSRVPVPGGVSGGVDS